MECHAADVLHRAPVVFSNCNLIVLSKWIGKTEGLFEVSKSLLSNFEDVLGIDILKE